MIVAVPDAPVPVTTPVLPTTEAIAGALLVQVPPGVTSDKVVVNPEQTLSVPSIAAGKGLTVTVVVMMQPVPMV